LDIADVRQLEDLIIGAFYEDVLKGKMDQKRKQLEVEYTMGRDLRPGQRGDVITILQNW
jgi:COP9 signalosome complex subunit 7